ncbi:MAG: hypothetical protein AABY03_00015 [Nanoarchaeota archaeon]
MATVKQILGKINPGLYAENGVELLAKYKTIDKIPADEVKPKALAEHKIIYDSSSEGLEPIYFWLVDFMENRGLSSEKLVDNFASSPGSGHFAELGQRATVMQQQGSKILGDVNTVLRSVLNLIYDLKEFKIRLEHYDNLMDKDKSTVEAARLSLKQIWQDKVDITKGNSGIKVMSFQGGFQTLLHAFLAAEKEKDVDRMDLNDVVKRILKPRVQEFNIWVEQSEKELRKRYELERIYLRSQVNSLKLYSRWAKPYLRAAQQLEMKDMSKDVALVKVFNTILLELSLMGKMELKVKESAMSGELPNDLQDMKFDRKYYSCVLVDLRFRGIPQRAGQQSHYVFGGKADVIFSAYSLNSDELEMFKQLMDKSDVEDVLKLIDGASSDSINQLQEEISFFLEDKEKEEEKKRKKDGDEINPFLAIGGFYNVSSEERKSMEGKSLGEKFKKIFSFSGSEEKKEKSKEKKEIKFVKPDNWIEKTQLREFTIKNAIDINFDTFDIYKKNHGMSSFT